MKTEWKALSYDELKDTIFTVQLWTQIVGKIRLRRMPWINHSWHVTLYVSSRGFTTGSIPYSGSLFQIEFDFVDHVLVITSSSGNRSILNLESGSISNFYQELFTKLKELNIDVEIYPQSNELEPAILFKEDNQERNYDPEKMRGYWDQLIKINNLLRFSSRFHR